MHIRSSAGFYGAEAVIASLALAQRALGCRPIVLSLSSGGLDDPLVRSMRDRGVDAMSVVTRGRVDAPLVGRIADAIRAYPAEIVHLHGYKEDLYGLPAARRAGVPTLVTNHLWNSTDWKVRCYEQLDAWVLRAMAPRVVAVSQTIRREMISKGISPDRVTVIPNAVPQAFLDTPARAPRPRRGDGSPLVLATCARLAPEKGHRFMFEALGQLTAAEVRDVTWRIIGDGPLRESLESEVRARGLSDRVSVEGYCRDIQNVLAAVDVVVQPSLKEGMPIAVLEAMAQGLCVVSSSVGAVPEIIADGVSGLLVPPGDARALSVVLRRLLGDPAMVDRLGKAAYERVRADFTPLQMARRYQAEYASELERRDRRH